MVNNTDETQDSDLKNESDDKDELVCCKVDQPRGGGHLSTADAPRQARVDVFAATVELVMVKTTMQKIASSLENSGWPFVA